MSKGKPVRSKGKLKLSDYFKKIRDGERVSVIGEGGVQSSFPKRISGMSGIVAGSRGTFKLVKIMDGGKSKTFIIHPVHLRTL